MRKSGPEKMITEPMVLGWALRHGFDLTVVDTSATFSRKVGRYLKSQASESLPDLVGNKGSLSVWIELKAPGCRSAINAAKNAHQLAFLKRKIEQGCFACVSDSASHIDQLWAKYIGADPAQRIGVLFDDIPKPRKGRRTSL